VATEAEVIPKEDTEEEVISRATEAEVIPKVATEAEEISKVTEAETMLMVDSEAEDVVMESLEAHIVVVQMEKKAKEDK